MGKIVKALLALVVLYVVVMGGSGLAIRLLLSGETGERLRAKAQESLPVEVSISGGDFDIAKWFLFQPSLSFENLRIANPEGFSDEPLLTAALVSADADLSSLLGDGLEIGEIAIVEPNLLVESNADGVTNIDALLVALRSEEAARDSPPAENGNANPGSVTVLGFTIEDGIVRYLAPGEPPMIAKNVNIRVIDFAPDAIFPLSASLDLFEEEAARLSFTGHVGPFNPESAPADGDLALEAAVAKLPKRFRVETLGDFIVSPGDDSRLTLDAKLSGDLFEDFSGDGVIRFNDIKLGKADKPQLPLSGEAPVSLMIRNALANPSWALQMPDANLQLGAGSWTGSVEVAESDGRIAGHSAGAIRGIDINQILTALTDSENVVFGLLELDRYDIEFAGRDAAEIQDSLQGAGRLDLRDGKLAILDTLATVEQKINQVLKGEQSYVQGFTSFIRAGTDFEIADRTVTTPNLILENDSAEIAAAGSFGFDNSLDYDVSSLITGPLAAALGGKAADGVARLAAPLRITGTIESPRAYLDVKNLAKQTAVSQAKGLLDKLLNKGAEPEPTEDTPTEEPKKKPLFGFGDLLDKVLEKNQP